MNRTFYLMVFAICLAANYGLISAAPAEALSAAPKNNLGSYLHPSSRIHVEIGSRPQPSREKARDTMTHVEINEYPSFGVVRQAPPPDFTPPPPPPPPAMFMDKFSRKKREAKGGGSMPTRKG